MFANVGFFAVLISIANPRSISNRLKRGAFDTDLAFNGSCPELSTFLCQAPECTEKDIVETYIYSPVANKYCHHCEICYDQCNGSFAQLKTRQGVRVCMKPGEEVLQSGVWLK